MQSVLLIFDNECPLCRRAQAWVAAHALPGAIRYLPCQSPDLSARAPQVSRDNCMEAMQLVFPDGTVYAAEQAFPHLLRRMPGYRWLAVIMQCPGPRHLAPWVYRWIARRRMMLSGLFVHKDPQTRCDIDEGCR